jgi:polyferredoxin
MQQGRKFSALKLPGTKVMLNSRACPAGDFVFRKRTPEDRQAAARRRKQIFQSRPRAPFRPRTAVQILSMTTVLLIGWQFFSWVRGLEGGITTGNRPAGVEGFLPISALISLRHWFESGEFSLIHPAGLVILCLVLLTGLFLKKAFCSWICPVGSFSEILARLSHKVFRRRLKLPMWLDYPLMSLKYLLLLFFAYAIFITMSPQQISDFLVTPYNKVADIKMLYFFTDLSATSLWVLGILTGLSFLLPYFWCRYLCPYGALIGLVSLFSVTKVRRSAPDCTNCGKCAAVCPSFLAVDLKTSVNSVECTGCLECVTNCPEENALQVRTPRLFQRTVRPAVFAVLVMGVFYGGIQVAKLSGYWNSQVDQSELVDRVRQGLEGPEYDHVGRPSSNH